MKEDALGETDTARFSESLEVQSGFFLLQLWNKVIRAADLMESCGHSGSATVMGEVPRKTETEKKCWRVEVHVCMSGGNPGFPASVAMSSGTEPHFILILD